MRTLTLQRFRCIHQAGIAADTPYFLTCVADLRTAATTVELTYRSEWRNNVDNYEAYSANDVVGTNIDFNPAHVVVICALMEQNDERDIVNAERLWVAANMKAAVQHYHDIGEQTAKAPVVNALIDVYLQKLQHVLRSVRGNRDKFVQARAVKLQGDSDGRITIRLSGEDGRYDVYFTLQ